MEGENDEIKERGEGGEVEGGGGVLIVTLHLLSSVRVPFVITTVLVAYEENYWMFRYIADTAYDVRQVSGWQTSSV